MDRIKGRWDIEKNWQYIFPFLGYALNLFTAYIIAKQALKPFNIQQNTWNWIALILVSIAIHFLLLRFFLWCFEKLKNKWVTQYRWEMIAIFIVFGITGSLSARVAGPIMDFFGIFPNSMPAFWYWTIRILIVLPIYQVLLIAVGWLFGQFQFFYKFEKKMLKRFGIHLK